MEMPVFDVLITRRTSGFSEPEDIKAEMEDMRVLLADRQDLLAFILREMEEDLAFAEELHRDSETARQAPGAHNGLIQKILREME